MAVESKIRQMISDGEVYEPIGRKGAVGAFEQDLDILMETLPEGYKHRTELVAYWIMLCFTAGVCVCMYVLCCYLCQVCCGDIGAVFVLFFALTNIQCVASPCIT